MIGRYSLLRYLAGATSARTADEMSAPALLLLGLAVSGSARTASLLYAGVTISAAFGGPFLGALLDRSARPGRLLAWTMAAYAAGLALITISLGQLPTAIVVGIAVLAGFLAPALSGGWTSRLPDVVPAGQLARGHSLDAATYSAAALAGPALAGILAAAAGADWAMAAVVVLLLLAAPAAAARPGPAASARPGPKRRAVSGTAGDTGRTTVTWTAGAARPTTVAHDLRAGFRAITGTPSLLRITTASAIAYLGIAMLIVTCPLLGARFLGGPDRGVLLLSVLAATSLAATALAARWPPRLRPDAVFAGTTAVAGCGLAGLSLARGAGFVVISVAVIGIADGPQLAAVFGVRHRDAPYRLRGQIFTTAASVKITAGAIGAWLAGLIAAHSLALALAAAAATQGAALAAFAAMSKRLPPAAAAAADTDRASGDNRTPASLSPRPGSARSTRSRQPTRR